MARKAITDTLYAELKDAFRQRPAAYLYASRQAKCDDRTAKRGWLQGWPPNFLAIKDALEDERTNARAIAQAAAIKAQEAQAEAAKLARQQAIDTLATEAKLLGAARNTALGGLAVHLGSLPAIRILAENAKARIEKGESVAISEAFKLVHMWSRGVRDLASMVKGLVESERLRLGKPTEIVGVDVSLGLGLSGPTMEEAETLITDAHAMLSLVQSRRSAAMAAAAGPVLDGGDGLPSPPAPNPASPAQPALALVPAGGPSHG